MQVQALTGSHDRRGFDCARVELNDWLQKIARQHQDKGLSRTFVATREEEPTRICAFYALTVAELDRQHLPEHWRQKLPLRLPAVRLGRLGVDTREQGAGLGTMMLMDALSRSRRIFEQAGGIGLFVDAIDAQAANFYQRFGFSSAPDKPLFMFLPLQLMSSNRRVATPKSTQQSP